MRILTGKQEDAIIAQMYKRVLYALLMSESEDGEKKVSKERLQELKKVAWANLETSIHFINGYLTGIEL